MTKPGYCEACKHAEFAHNGLSHPGQPKGCDLCNCKEYRETK